MYTACVLGDLNNTGYAYICGPTSIFFYPPQLSVSFNVQVGGRTLVSSFAPPPPTPGRGILLGMCRWPLRAPTPLKSILLQTIDPILVSFEQM